MLQARLRAGKQWGDACILFSRGLPVHSPRGISQAGTIELRGGDYAICARVVWHEGGGTGLQSDEQLPVEQIMSLDQSQVLQLTASRRASVERRRRPRAETDARLREGTLEVVRVGIIAASLAVTIWSMAERALARSMGGRGGSARLGSLAVGKAPRYARGDEPSL
jgi:hypothetical protein